MHEALVILKKDLWRLWWQIAAMLAMLATVGCLDAGRAAAQTGILESLLNMLIPLVWACLIAQAVQGEPLVGDREFWMTRPYRWPCLLAAKVLFVALCVHVPSFLTDVAILAARGYSPIVSLPQLLVKQLLLAGGLTLPAMALAALVNNLAQFVIGIPVLFVTFGVSAGLQPSPTFVFMISPFAHLAVAVLAVAAVWIVVLQYRQRRTRLARVLAVSTLLALGVLTPLAASRQAFGLNALELPAANVHAAMTLGPPDPRAVHGPFSRRVFTTLPFTVSGIRESDPAWVVSVFLEIAAANGVRYRNDPPHMDFDVGLTGIQHGSTRLFLGTDHAAYDRIKDSRVTISGKVGFLVYERGQEVRLPPGASRAVTGSLHCSTSFTGGQNAWPLLTVLCDTPGPYGVLAEIGMDKESMDWWWPDSRRAGAMGFQGQPFGWQSPLQWQEQSFQPKLDRALAPGEAPPDHPIVIVPQRLAGYSTVAFRASDIDLREYSR